MKKPALVLIPLLIVFAIPYSFKAEESNITTAVATTNAGIKPTEDKWAVMKGAWEVSAQGTQGNYGQNVKALTQTFTLTITGDKKDKIPVTGKPFGFTVIKSSLQTAGKNKSVSFKLTYRMDKDYDIDFRGKLNEDGTEIIDGKFSFILGKGMFKAKKIN